MEHNTITLARHATAPERPESTVIVRPPDQAQEPELKRLGNQIAELSARIDAANYELLCQLREFDRRYGWEGWR
ncbi:MAG: hypothetical protein OXC12_20350, partial [Spirochaetaceae bacterium]|nr:hypothetical protein [Spirochaetaceae bacterium]